MEKKRLFFKYYRFWIFSDFDLGGDATSPVQRLCWYLASLFKQYKRINQQKEESIRKAIKWVLMASFADFPIDYFWGRVPSDTESNSIP